MARQLLAGGGLSLEDAKMMAPRGEFLAYINPKEADMLRSAGGSGIMTAAGIPSFVDYGDVESGLAGGEFGGGSPEDTFGGGDSGFDDTADVNLGLAGGRTAFTQPDNDGGGLSNIINYISDNKKGILQNIIGTALLGPAYPMIGLGLAGIGAYRNMRNNNLIDDTDGGIGDKFKDTLDRFKQLGDPNKYLADLTKKQKQMLQGPQKNLRNIMGISDEEILKNISPFNDPKAPATLEDVQNFYKV